MTPLRVVCPLFIVLVLAGPAGAAVFPYNFIATYTISGDSLQYSEWGSLNQLLVCSAPWTTSPLPVRQTADPSRNETIRMSVSLKKWIHEVQADFLIRGSEAACLGSVATLTPMSECQFERDWVPSPVPTDTRDLALGWKVLDSVKSRATGGSAPTFVETHSRNVDLRVNDLKPAFVTGAIPFTGRVEFQDPESQLDIEGEWERTYDVVAGKCFPSGESPAATCGAQCQYIPAEHQIEFTVRRTAGGDSLERGVELPLTVGPLGDWQVDLKGCNLEC